jgi:RNA polymerase sigma factor (sigma-70 family)
MRPTALSPPGAVTTDSAMRHADFERLYADHAQNLLAFLVYKTGDRPLAEDLLVDTFERVLTAKRGFDRRKASEKTWLYTIALNLVRDHARRSAAESRAVERVEAGVTEGPGRGFEELLSDRDSLGQAMDVLSTEEREAISLRFGADLTVPEIAKLTGEKLTTVEGRVYRALAKLRDAMS